MQFAKFLTFYVIKFSKQPYRIGFAIILISQIYKKKKSG